MSKTSHLFCKWVISYSAYTSLNFFLHSYLPEPLISNFFCCVPGGFPKGRPRRTIYLTLNFYCMIRYIEHMRKVQEVPRFPGFLFDTPPTFVDISPTVTLNLDLLRSHSVSDSHFRVRSTSRIMYKLRSDYLVLAPQPQSYRQSFNLACG